MTKIERQGWNALVTMELNGNVALPANATAKLGQTSLLGSLHIELAPPTDAPPEGRLHEGSLIPLESGSKYPSTEQTLAAVALLLNGGGIGHIQDITEAFSTAWAGREADLRSLIEQLDVFIGYVNDQKGDIIAANESLNNLVGQFAEQKPVVDKALRTIPDALAVLKDQRDNLAEALAQLGKFSALAADSVDQTNEALVQELKDLGPVLESAGQRRARAHPGTELPADLSVPQGNTHQLDSRRLRQSVVDRRHDVEPDRRRVLHRDTVRVQSDLDGVAVGPHHRPDAQSVQPPCSAAWRQPVARGVPLGSGAMTCE